MPYEGLAALKAKIDDPVVREWADSLKEKSRTKLFTFLQFWEWAKEHKVTDPKTGEEKVVSYWKSGKELLADYDRFKTSGKPELEFRHLKVAMEFVKNKQDKNLSAICDNLWVGENVAQEEEREEVSKKTVKRRKAPRPALKPTAPPAPTPAPPAETKPETAPPPPTPAEPAPPGSTTTEPPKEPSA
jgi:hypothetical protein